MTITEIILMNATILIIGFAFILGVIETITRNKKTSFSLTYQEVREKSKELYEEAKLEGSRGNSRKELILASESKAYSDIANLIINKTHIKDYEKKI